MTITLRTVDKFPEPAFTALVDRLLHDADRQSVRERFVRTPAMEVLPTAAKQVRIGAYTADGTLVGWSHATHGHGGMLYVTSSAVEPAFRRQGVYTRLVGAMEQEALALGCLRIESNHRAANADVLIAKLKLGYIIVGTEFSAEMGLLVRLSKQLEGSRRELFEARSGVVEGSARFFGRS